MRSSHAVNILALYDLSSASGWEPFDRRQWCRTARGGH